MSSFLLIVSPNYTNVPAYLRPGVPASAFRKRLQVISTEKFIFYGLFAYLCTQNILFSLIF